MVIKKNECKCLLTLYSRTFIFVVISFIFIADYECCVQESSLTGFKLISTTFITNLMYSNEDCFHSCLHNRYCQSYNLDFIYNKCELLNVSQKTHPQNIQPASNWTYMTNIYHSCTTSPCKNNGTCTGATEQIKCLCPVYFKGDRCQENATYSSCSDIRAGHTDAVDGHYFILPSLYPNKKIKVFCKDMSSRPTEWLTVNSTTNVAHVDSRRNRNWDVCQMNGPFESNYVFASAGHTVFNKVNLDLKNMRIRRGDFTFATTNGKNIQYGRAGDCHGRSSCPLGFFMIDLTGNCNRLRDIVTWVDEGTGKNYIMTNYTINPSRTGAFARCGGLCAYCYPQGGEIYVEPTDECY